MEESIQSALSKAEKDAADLAKYREFCSIEDLPNMINKDDTIRFYYWADKDDYIVGMRHDSLYYANVKEFGIEFFMSKYLPWEQPISAITGTVERYPSEPVEIPFYQWLKGYIEKYT